MSMREAARLANLSFPYVGDIETGSANATIDKIETLAAVVGLTVEVRSLAAQSLRERALVALGELDPDALALEVEMLERRAGAAAKGKTLVA